MEVNLKMVSNSIIKRTLLRTIMVFVNGDNDDHDRDHDDDDTNDCDDHDCGI